MDRELVLAILVALFCGSALTVAGFYPTGSPDAASAAAFERRAWRRMWGPFAPAVLLFAALCGWALVEPADAERVPNSLLWAAMPFAAVVVRAALRAVASLRTSHEDPGVATVGLLRPRILLSPRIATHLDAPALAAALEHERAHARHRDPLRLWLAQLGSDLLWPWPAAYSRFLWWRRALELARDEEARLNGIAGPDLAAAILASLRFRPERTPLSAATLAGDASLIQERIARLMRPLETVAPRAYAVWPVALAVGALLALQLGSAFGERVVQALLGV